jgi:hypothetical protein
LSTHLQGYNSWISKTRGVKKGDIELLLDPAKQGTTPFVRITEREIRIDGEVRRIVCFDGFKHFLRSITNIAVLLPEEEEEEMITNRPETRDTRKEDPKK